MKNPYALAMDMQRQAWEGAAETAENLAVAPDRSETLNEVEVGQTPHEVVYEENKLHLKHYEPLTEEQHDVPILITYALINRPYILDLQPDRSVVQTLLEEGFDVYLIDWGEPSPLDRSLTLEDYVSRYIDNCVDVVRERSGVDAINLLGYCMGGTMSAMYAALDPEKVRNLGLMAAGLCFTGEGGVLELWGAEEYYDPEAVTDTFGNVPAEFLDLGFALMDPVQNNVTKYVRFYENMADEDFVENFARMEKWLGDGIDVAGATYDQFISDVYQENKLIENELYLGDDHVDVENLEMPILQIVAEYDHLIPPGASKPFNDAIPSEDTEIMEFPTGHIGMSVSSRSHGELWPDVCDWFAERSRLDEDGETLESETEATGPTDRDEALAEEPSLAEDAAGDETGADVESTEADGAGVTSAMDVDDLTALDGVGDSYADDLRAAGIETFSDLATADVTALAADTGISPGRIENWVEQARDR
ncbi:class III poly(R)-hydroxyalkanoic acid synthase subunit PhaC [Natrialbaceae archaeon AArc-T1-2]|uniref:class III poly(R)-hydroxyalkanoic acid synthase subunit PhaC n=1 Tax=Natrialbaceae archaeon AArc-T1-2 TaxID=3053904 RepID=UPI00255AFD2A|nr:class III poly(R)-hydroxyalkanoic acid synthase subunit PhaC [Natrialbaceae archaeon AArc-T1-2]WIV68254.1 class III poly(R)-hydroxyalkanoic acid synthase subunit PhaC [Natrialbaceae archaeon AArc-T1-2]